VEVGDGEAVDRRSTAGQGHAIILKAPGKKRLLTGFQMHASRYGRFQWPADEFFHVFLCDARMRPLQRTALPFALVPEGDPDWIEFELPGWEVPSSFGLLIYFEPTATRGVYLSMREDRSGRSLHALPDDVQGKVKDRLGWMIRAALAPSAGARPLAAEAISTEADAVAVAELLDRLDRAELREDVAMARGVVSQLRVLDPKSAEAGTIMEASAHFFLRCTGVKEADRAALLTLLEAAHAVLVEEFGFARISAIEGKRIHLRIRIDPSNDTQLFTSPSSPAFSLIVLRGDERALRSPLNGGPHVVYGFLHELGHVLMGFEDSDHQWAHYLGSALASRIYELHGADIWPDRYDFHTLEGMPRFLGEIEDDADTSRARRIGRALHQVAEEFGTGVFGPACAWVMSHRDGTPFHAVELYRIADFGAGLAASVDDPERVRSIFAAVGED
jgi:hypothetical protein